MVTLCIIDMAFVWHGTEQADRHAGVAVGSGGGTGQGCLGRKQGQGRRAGVEKADDLF